MSADTWPTTAPGANTSKRDNAPDNTVIKRLKLTRASDVQAVAVTWLHDGLIPLKTITVVAGMSGIGKTTLVLLWMAQITRGELPGEFLGRPQDVLIMSPEDDPGAITRPRLEAAGADLDRVHFVSVTRRTASGEVETIATFPTDLDILREAVVSTNAVAILLDPIASLIDGNLDKREDVRAAFDALAGEIANKYELAVVLIAHNKKGIDSVRSKVSGSAAITDAARSVLALGRDDETGQIILSVDKSSYSTTEGTNHAYMLMTTPVALASGGTTDVARAVYIGETSISVAELNERHDGSDDEHDDRNAAQSFVLDYLKGIDVQEANASDVLKAGRAAGFTDKDLKNARGRCKNPRVVSRKSGFGAGWVWAIDESEQHEGLTKASKDSALENVSSSSPSVSPSPLEPAAPVRNLTPAPGTCRVCAAPLLAPASRAAGICGKRNPEHDAERVAA
ncbi:AAA family ATPase [Cryobacterium sp. Hh11]|uniref:AAA family ATPase n=1 Tax=Cryobacterium sp. Hh11 TaxID=2555868 RepID=UPI001069999B|nr:AAA family ATPase [Cryobacterium sp. Hh11]TFD48714.1 AAA family ATPase [Cryobacterium sp. Hh11]